jgi:hypothetical protein
MSQLQVRGCLPVLVTLTLVGAGVALVIFASFAVVLPVAAALLVLGLARALWYRLTGRPLPTAPPPRGFTTGDFSDDEGPVVDALPRSPSLEGGEGEGKGQGQGERSDPGA